MKTLIGLLIGIVLLLSWSTYRIYKYIDYGRNCQGYLKRAADSNTVEQSIKQLTKALEYIKTHNLTTGYTSIFYTTPNEDIEFWYNNLKESLIELQKVDTNSTQLERSNLLMKLRETLLDAGKEGVSITDPKGISVYPHNTFVMIWGILGCIFGIIFTPVYVKAWIE